MKIAGFFYTLTLCVTSLLVMAQQQEDKYLVTGTYTGGRSEGIYVYTFNTNTGAYKEVSHVKSSNPSFIAVSPDEKYVYAVNENSDNDNGGEVSAFSFDKKNGTLTFLNKQLSGGDHPCYVEVDKTGKWVIAGNYSSGTLSVLPVQPDGSVGEAVTTIRHTGSGVNKDRQEKPHVHCTILSADNRWLFVPDLGIDKVMIYAFDAATGGLTPAPQPFAKVADGVGPRHLTFHPNNKYAYLMEEMGGAVTVFDHIGGRLHAVQHIKSVQDSDKEFIGSADIHVSEDGRFLYASNRGGFNTIAIFSIDQQNGKLTLTGHQPSGGQIPRNFTVSPGGNFLLAANQDSDNIAIFKINKKTGALTDTGKRMEVGKPVCLKWINK
ncbi:MAG: lactonase family protein [Chitinophagaceae bacterium]|nr:lactonase family protein [Chitinophagaceae bacterium]